jgi:hypothetical protein
VLAGRPRGQHAAPGGRPGKSQWLDPQLREELAYCVPLGIPHSRFLSWAEEDQAFLRERSTVCTGCGTRQADWDRDRFAYVAESHQCSGCELLAQEQENLPKQAQGIRSYLVPRSPADSME